MVVLPFFADVIASLLLFDSTPTFYHHGQLGRSVEAVVAPPSSIIASNSNNFLYQNQYYKARIQDNTKPFALASTLLASVPAQLNSQYPSLTATSWNLPNGKVQFDQPLSFAGIKMMQNGEIKTVDENNDSSLSTPSIVSLWNPVFLGRYEQK